MLGLLDANIAALNEYCCCIHTRYQVSFTRCLVQGTDRRSLYVVSRLVLVSLSYEQNEMFLFLRRSVRNYTCLHDFKNEVTNRRGKKTPFLSLKKNA